MNLFLLIDIDQIGFHNKFLNKPFLGAKVENYAWFLLLVLIAGALRHFLSKYSVTILYKLFSKSIKSENDSAQIHRLLGSPMEGLLTVLISYLGVNQIDTVLDSITIIKRSRQVAKDTGGLIANHNLTLLDTFDKIYNLLIIYYITLVFSRAIKFFFYVAVKNAKTNGDKQKQQILPLLKDLLVVLLWAIGISTILGMVFNVNVTALIAGLGMGGIAIAFAAKESLENLLASILIMLDKPFDIGDYIKISGVEGSVETIGFRSSKLRTLDNTIITLPNKTLISNSMENITQRGQRRCKFTVGAVYGLSVDTMQQITQEIVQTLIDKNDVVGTPIAYLDSFGDSSVNITVIYNTTLVKTGIFELEKEKAMYEVYKIMYKYGHGFAFPTTSVINTSDLNEVFSTEKSNSQDNIPPPANQV